MLLGSVASLDAQPLEPLFSAGSGDPALAAPAADPRPFVVRSRLATVQLDPLTRALSSPATDSFTLNLFDDASFAVTYERVEDSGFGHRSWAGHIEDRPLSAVTLTLRGDFMTGLITNGTTVYEIAGLGGGLHRIDQLDATMMPRDTDIALPREDAPIDDAVAPPAFSSPAAASTADIFVYYTSALRASVPGGAAEVQNRIAQYVADTNAAYQRSGVDGELRLVGFAEAPVAGPMDPLQQLHLLTDSPDVVNQRNASGADLVSLLVANFQGDTQTTITCGIAWVGPGSGAAFSVVASRSACVYTFAHETGHNLGGQHAPGDPVIDPSEGDYPLYARGHKVQAGVNFRTVMAYECATGPSCPRVRNFSNPAVSESGQPTGILNQRENARRFNELFPLVAAYRAGGPPLSPPSAPQNLTATVSGSTVNLSWQPGAGGGAPADYLLVAGTGPGSSNLVPGLPFAGTSLSAPGIGTGTYYIRVHARNAAGISGPSNEAVAIVGPACTPPSAPQNFTFTKGGFNLGLSWSAPAVGTPPFIYGLLAGSAPGGTNLFFGAIGSITSIGGTVPAGNYFVRVIAANACGVGPTTGELAIAIP